LVFHGKPGFLQRVLQLFSMKWKSNKTRLFLCPFFSEGLSLQALQVSGMAGSQGFGLLMRMGKSLR
jgi:hypothetical protein